MLLQAGVGPLTLPGAPKFSGAEDVEDGRDVRECEDESGYDHRIQPPYSQSISGCCCRLSMPRKMRGPRILSITTVAKTAISV